MGYNKVMFLEFLVWWYGPGWLKAWKAAGRWINRVQLQFSIPELIRNLFSPWKQIVSLPGRSIDEKFHAMIDNLFSRAVGFVVRIIVLFIACILIVLAAVVGVALAILWPLLPAVIAYCVYRSLVG
jgi:hypothetical protein